MFMLISESLKFKFLKVFLKNQDQYNGSIQKINTTDQYNRSIQKINTTDQYNRSIQKISTKPEIAVYWLDRMKRIDVLGTCKVC
jgi:hypothetical protein